MIRLSHENITNASFLANFHVVFIKIYFEFRFLNNVSISVVQPRVIFVAQNVQLLMAEVCINANKETIEPSELDNKLSSVIHIIQTVAETNILFLRCCHLPIVG
jgi:hypothetical protein